MYAEEEEEMGLPTRNGKAAPVKRNKTRVRSLSL
jgi:hypothetical protein